MSYEIQILLSRIITIFSLWFTYIAMQQSTDPSLILIELTLTLLLMIAYFNFVFSDTLHTMRYLTEGFFIVYILLSLALPNMIIFLPVVVAEVNRQHPWQVFLILSLFVYGHFVLNNIALFFAYVLLSILLFWFYKVLREHHQFEHQSFLEINQLRNLNTHIQQEQDLLLALQDQHIEASRNLERKRIINEIHDILGHQLSSAIIQIAALQYISEDVEIKQQLKYVEDVLQDSMDNIRTVIHNERDQAMDLKTEIEEIIDDFVKCPIIFQYHNQTLPTATVSHVISNSIREALTNINKHSNATRVEIIFQEHINHWQLLIKDNGTQQKDKRQTSGIGLMNMEERVLRLKGTFHVSRENGFRVFITIPKGDKNYESTFN